MRLSQPLEHLTTTLNDNRRQMQTSAAVAGVGIDLTFTDKYSVLKDKDML